jgi:polar amino acid transport system substrate-binding protein
MDHGLLVSSEYVAKVVAVLVEGLGHPPDISMTEDAKATTEEIPSLAVPLGLLGQKETNHGLSRGQTLCFVASHAFLSDHLGHTISGPPGCAIDIMHSRHCRAIGSKSYNATVSAASPTPSRRPPSPDPAAAHALAPNGVLRAGINLSNFLLVSGTGDVGQPLGLSPSLATALAEALVVPLDLVTFADPGDLVDALASGELDIGNVGADPGRAEHLAFTAPYCEIEATYLVRGDSPITMIDEVDRPGVRIASRRRAAYTLWLDRNISQAQLIHTETIDESFDLFVADRLEVLAGLRPRLMDDTARIPGSRLLDGRFTAVQQAIGTHRDRGGAGLAYLEHFVEWAIKSGFVAALIDHYQVRGLSVAETL